MAGYSIVKRQRKYYKDGVEVPSSSITDFGSYRYFKNVVITKYWKEITTGSKELGYYCYYLNRTLAGYFYASPKLDVLYYSNVSSNGTTFDAVSSPEQLKEFYSGEYRNLTADSVQVNVEVLSSSYVTVPRLATGDLYIDTTVTETVEGTPEDYTYTTEEIVPVEVTADDDYDYTEFVPSTQFDYYEDNNKLYQLAKVKRGYYKDGVEVPSSSITDFGGTKYYKNIVTTKYWKEITTGGRELAYAGYTGYAMNTNFYMYAKAPLGSDMVAYAYDTTASRWASDISQLKDINAKWTVVQEDTATDGFVTYNRSYANDLYIDTIVTETVEGTPEDYIYTTEETETIEVTADDDYDYTEVVPSTQFDYYTDRLLSYEIIKGVK